jgi:hypothetical protein
MSSYLLWLYEHVEISRDNIVILLDVYELGKTGR